MQETDKTVILCKQESRGEMKYTWSKSPLMIAGLVAILLLSGIIVAGFTWEKKTITLAVDGKQMQLKTRATTVGDLLQENEIKLSSQDKVHPASSEQLKDGDQVEVLRAHPVSLIVDGKTSQFITVAKTVKDVLEEKDVVLGEHDKVEPAITQKLTNDLEIKVTRVQIKEETMEVAIPYQVRRETNASIPTGLVQVVQKGVQGMEAQRWQYIYEDGQLVEQNLIERNTMTAAVDEIVQAGSAQTVSRGGTNLRFSKVIKVVATAYTHTGNNTATGKAPYRGIVAVDTNVIPFGTKLYVEGYGVAEAADRGGAIKGNRIDLFMETASEARRWGVKTVDMYILE